MKALKSHTALLIISNTITIIPYLYFLSLSKEQSLSAALAFALFYTFRMTGVFFLTDAYGAFRTIALSSQCLDRRRRRIGRYLEHLVERCTLASCWFVGDQCFLVAAS